MALTSQSVCEYLRVVLHENSDSEESEISKLQSHKITFSGNVLWSKDKLDLIGSVQFLWSECKKQKWKL